MSGVAGMNGGLKGADLILLGLACHGFALNRAGRVGPDISGCNRGETPRLCFVRWSDIIPANDIHKGRPCIPATRVLHIRNPAIQNDAFIRHLLVESKLASCLLGAGG